MELVRKAKEAIQNSQRLFVVSGAGISAASGIPTFRGEGGLWRGFRAEQLATVDAFESDPAQVWEWYRWRRSICRAASPNAAHEALVALEEMLPAFFLATQNVDGLHREAGSLKQVELHGSIDRIRCTVCAWIEPNSEDPKEPLKVLPSCTQCGSLSRPHILWFGETYWPGVMEQAILEAERADVCLVVGTSGRVWPPIGLALAAKRSGALLIEVNPEATVLTEQSDLSFRVGAQELLPCFLP